MNNHRQLRHAIRKAVQTRFEVCITYRYGSRLEFRQPERGYLGLLSRTYPRTTENERKVEKFFDSRAGCLHCWMNHPPE